MAQSSLPILPPPTVLEIRSSVSAFAEETTTTRLIARRPDSMITADVFESYLSTIETETRAKIDVRAGSIIGRAGYSDTTRPFLEEGHLNADAPSLSIPADGTIHFSTPTGIPHPITKISAPLTLRGNDNHNATLNNLPSTNSNLELAGPIILDHYHLTLPAATGLVNTGHLKIESAHISIGAGGTFRNLHRASVSGTGTFDVPDTICGGAISPGTGNQLGNIAFTGDLTCSSTSEIVVSIQGDVSDTVTVSGRASLGGYVIPQVGGASFADLNFLEVTFLTAAPRMERFSRALRGSSPLTLSPNLRYSPTKAALAFSETAPPSGFDISINIDFTDAELAAPRITGPNADPDNDGLTNLAEHALGTSLRSPSVDPFRIFPNSSDGGFILEFPQVDGITDVFTTIQSQLFGGPRLWSTQPTTEIESVPLEPGISLRRHVVPLEIQRRAAMRGHHGRRISPKCGASPVDGT